ncbi:MAG: MFS transporter [Burkholderiaceae bacterium]
MDAPAAAPAPRAALALAVVCAGAMLGPLDTSVNIAFPAITAAFALAPRDIQWVVLAFVLAQSSLAIVFGRLGDLHGHRRVFALGMVACALTHAAAGFAPDYATLVGLRALQGIAVGVAIACGPALAASLYPERDKRRVLSIYASAFGAGLAIGPLAGGWLVDALGWPGVFWFRAPLALAVLLALPLLPGGARVVGAPASARFDAPGAALLAAALVGASVFVIALTQPGVPAAARAVAAAASVALVVAFVRHARRSPAPVMRVEPFAQPRFAALQAGSVLINLACFSILLLVPYVLVAWPATSTSGAGVVLAAYPAGSLAGSAAAGRFASARTSSSVLALGGIAAAGLGLLATAACLPWQAPAALAAALALAGAGLGVFQVGYLDATTSMLPPAERGVAGSLVSVTRLLGIVLGVTGIGVLAAALGDVPATVAAAGAGLVACAAGGAAARSLAARRR